MIQKLILNKAGWKMYLGLVLLWGIIYSGVYHLYADKYFALIHKYDISAEVFKRLLFTHDLASIDAYCKHVYNQSFDIVQHGFNSAITDERPVFFLFLAVIKLFDMFPVGLYFGINMALLLASLVIIAKTFAPQKSFQVILLGSLFFSPFFIFQTLVYGPQTLEIFVTCLGVYFYFKDHIGLSFACMGLSIGIHPGNMVLVGCMGLYHIYANYQKPKTILSAFAGGVVGLVIVEGILCIVFYMDTTHILPHEYLIERLLTNSDRMAGDVDKYSSFIRYWIDSLAYLPLATLGLFWIKDKFQFAVTVLPCLVYFFGLHFHMPGVHRVLFPVYFLGYGYFFTHLSEINHIVVKYIFAGIIFLTLCVTLTYYGFVANCLSLKADRPVTVNYNCTVTGTLYSKMNLYWNIKRLNKIDDRSDIKYDLNIVSVTQEQNIPSPYIFFPHFAQKMLSRIGLKDLIGLKTNQTVRIEKNVN